MKIEKRSDRISFRYLSIYVPSITWDCEYVVGISSHFVIASLEGVVEDITSEEASRNILAGVH